MPPKTGSDKVVVVLDDSVKKAVKAHKGDETKVNAGDLPPNVRGIAQLTDIGFKKYKEGPNKGKIFFSAAGSVLEPDEHKGAFTRIGPEKIFDTPDASGKKTKAEHVAWVLNELRKLGYNTAEMADDGLIEACNELKELKPCFKFRTWASRVTKEYPNPRTNHDWSGVVEYVMDDDAGAGVEDETGDGEEEATEEEATEEEVVEEAAEEEATEEGGEEEASEESEDLDALGAAADGNPKKKQAPDEDAQGRLTALAEEAGVDVSKYKTWALVVAALKKAAEGAGEEAEEAEEEEAAEEEAEEWKPKVKDVVKYQPIDPATKKPAINPKTKKAKLVDVEIKAVDAKKQTVDIKNLTDNKLVKGVAWSRLVHD